MGWEKEEGMEGRQYKGAQGGGMGAVHGREKVERRGNKRYEGPKNLRVERWQKVYEGREGRKWKGSVGDGRSTGKG